MSKLSKDLQVLESEAIHIIREAYSQSENPVILYSIGKDSSVLMHLIQKAFSPASVPIPVLHIDTKWKFKEMISFRDKFCKQNNLKLIVHTNPEGLKNGINPFSSGSKVHTDVMKTQALLQALNEHKFDLSFGGARRDEEKSRAKERVFSFRDKFHQWDPKNQRPELWHLYNGHKNSGESVRVFPLSNWTEYDIWNYIYQEDISVVPLYYAKVRPVVKRGDLWIMVDDERFPLEEGEEPQMRKVRFRTLGCYPLTGGMLSEAETLKDIVQEMQSIKDSERNTRLIDFDGEASMEKKKKEGYF